MNLKTLIILAIVTVFVAGIAGVMIVKDQQKVSPDQRQLVFPDLSAKIDAVTEINLATKAETFTLVKGEKSWTLREKHQYPGALDKISQLVFGIAELKTLEAKTSNPELYSKLGVEDISSPDAKSLAITLKDAQGKTLAGLLVGESRVAKIDTTRQEIYIRKADEKQAWLVVGTLPTDKKPTQWLDKQLADVNSERIQRIEVTHPDGEKVVVFRDAAENQDYQLAEMPADKTIKSAYTLKQMASLLADLNLEDVATPDSIDFAKDSSTEAVFTTFDGLKVTLTTLEKDDKHYAQFEVKFVPDAVKPSTEKKETSGKKPDEVKAEAETLQNRLKNWVFEIPAHKATAILKKQADLVEEKKVEKMTDEVGNVTTPAETLLEDTVGNSITPLEKPLTDALGNVTTTTEDTLEKSLQQQLF